MLYEDNLFWKKSKTPNPTKYQLRSAFLVALMVIICNIIWSLFGSLDHYLLSKIYKLLRPQHPLLKLLQRCHLLLSDKKESHCYTFPSTTVEGKNSAKLHPYHLPHGTPVTHEVPPKWAKSEEVLCGLKGKVKPQPSVKPRKLLKSTNWPALSQTSLMP